MFVEKMVWSDARELDRLNENTNNYLKSIPKFVNLLLNRQANPFL